MTEKRTKIIIIKDCKECPFISKDPQTVLGNTLCYKTNMTLVSNKGVFNIPAWCPLQDTYYED